MAKSRKLNPEKPADNFVEERPSAVENAKEPSIERTANGRFMEDNVFEAFVTYLKTKPYEEVAGLIQSLSYLPVMKNVVITYSA